MASNFYPFTAISGGGTGAMDAFPVAQLATGDVGKVVTATGEYTYKYNSATTDADDGLFRINPDDNGGNGRWHLVGSSAKIGAEVYNSSGQSVSTGTPTILTWDNATYNSGTFWVIGSPTRITIPTGVTHGMFSVYTFHDGSSATPVRAFSDIFKNGTQLVRNENTNSYEQSICFSFSAVVSAADYFEISAFQSTGGTRTYNPACKFIFRATEFA